MNVNAKKTKLTLKNGVTLNNNEKKKKKKKKKKSKFNKKRKDVIDNEKPIMNDNNDKQIELKKINGSGNIIVSGTTVTGANTKFSTEIKVGDIIGIISPNTKKEEVKIVRFILSDTNLSISSEFSDNITEYLKYFCISQLKPKKTKKEEAFERERKRLKTIESATGNRFYRSKGNKQLSREELLDLRLKKSGDRRC